VAEPSGTIDPTRQQLDALAEWPADTPVVMINLLAFEPGEGVRAYARYAEEVQPFLDAAGATLTYLGSARQVVIGEHERAWWDAIVVVSYPTAQAFLAMVNSPGYQAVHVHRARALKRAELIATEPGVL
jgi:uncharacterized protein (DUF1330 family)